MHNTIDIEDLKIQTGSPRDLDILLDRLNTGSRRDRVKSLAILAFSRGLTIRTISDYLGIARNTYISYKRRFVEGGAQELFASHYHMVKRADDEILKNEVFKIIH